MAKFLTEPYMNYFSNLNYTNSTLQAEYDFTCGLADTYLILRDYSNAIGDRKEALNFYFLAYDLAIYTIMLEFAIKNNLHDKTREEILILYKLSRE